MVKILRLLIEGEGLIVLGGLAFFVLGRSCGRLFLVRGEKGNRRVMEILRVLLEGGGVMVGYSL